MLFLAVLLGGCSTIAIDLPPITDSATGEHHNGKVVWRDLLTNTPAESRRFYGELFGWEFEKSKVALGFGSDDSYMLIRHNGEIIGGIVDANELRNGANISQWVMTMSVSDIAAVVERLTAEGGKVLTPPTAIPSRGQMAVVEDRSGAVLALIQTKDGDPPDREPVFNGWLWDELWTDDVAAATGFYERVVGLAHSDAPVGSSQSSYRVLKSGDTPRVGILQNPFADVRPVWVNYLRVEDPAAVTTRVESLGGSILVAAQNRQIGGTVAFIAGPSGAGIALQTWPLD